MSWGLNQASVLSKNPVRDPTRIDQFLGIVLGWPPDKQMNLLLRGTPQSDNQEERSCALENLPSDPSEAAALLLTELENSAQETIPNW